MLFLQKIADFRIFFIKPTNPRQLLWWGLALDKRC